MKAATQVFTENTENRKKTESTAFRLMEQLISDGNSVEGKKSTPIFSVSNPNFLLLSWEIVSDVGGPDPKITIFQSRVKIILG